MVSLRNLFKNIFDHSYADIERRPKVGHWTKVSPSAHLGENVELGNWAEVGNNSFIGNHCRLGPWAKVGNDVILGECVVLGSHTRVADGTVVPPFTTLGDNDLVHPLGVFPDMCFGSTISMDPKTNDMYIRAGVHQFDIPANVFWGDYEGASIALDLFMWGKPNPDHRQDLSQYKI